MDVYLRIFINSKYHPNRHAKLSNSKFSYKQMSSKYNSELQKKLKNYNKKVLFFDIRNEVIKYYHSTKKNMSI